MRRAARWAGRHRGLTAGLLLLFPVAFVAVFADAIAPHAPREILSFEHGPTVCDRYTPSADYLLGVDASCRDTFSRVVHGARISLAVGVLATLVALVIGVLVGGVAGMAGGRTDNALMRLTDATYAFPDLLLVILLAAALRGSPAGDWAGGLAAILLAIGLTGWVTLARLVRGQVLSLKEREFVLAARAMGAGDGRILVRHVLPNAAGPLLAAATLMVPVAIFAEAALSFIGIGIRPPTASWGTMVAEGYTVIVASYWPVVVPAAAIAVTLLGLTLITDALGARGRRS
jgi:oligopeptide transport system permease protein